MSITLDAIFENGVLRPLTKLNLRDGQRVTMTVDAAAAQRTAGEAKPPTSTAVGELLPFPPGHPLHGLRRISDEKAVAMLKVIHEAFGHVDDDDWHDPLEPHGEAATSRPEGGANGATR